MKKLSIAVLVITFLVFLLFQIQKSKDFVVLKIKSPAEIVIDLNKNGVEDDKDTITLKNVVIFSSKQNDKQKSFAKEIGISEFDALGLGYLSEKFVQEFFAGRKVKLKNLDSQNIQIFVNNKNYEDLLLEKGLALKNDKIFEIEQNQAFQENLKKLQTLNLVIFNNKSNKYHKLDCKYGILAHDSQIIPKSQLPKDATPCNFCFESEKSSLPDSALKLQQPNLIYQKGPVKFFLTDMTQKLKPDSSCNSAFCKSLILELYSANKSIDFAIYGYSKLPEIEQALLSAQERGVKVRFVYDTDPGNQNIYSDTLYLSKLLPDNNTDKSSKIMHNKFFIFDNKKVLTGSANISNTDTSGFNSNAVIIIDSPEIANLYTQEFEQMYSGKFQNEKSEIKKIKDEKFTICFSPADKAITKKIIPLIDSAKEYIYVPAFLITHKELSDHLFYASARGVDVKIILDATNVHKQSHSKIDMLRKYGVLVKTENYAGKLHSKSIIIDDLYTIIGSMNFSESGENFNDENLIIIKDPYIAKFYKTFFEYLWAKIPDYWLTHKAHSESTDSIGSCSDGIDNNFDGKIDRFEELCKPVYMKK